MLDEKDWKILKILKNNSEYTVRKIAKKIMLPATTVYHRITRLKKEGYIKKFTIEVNNNKVDLSFLAYVMISVNFPILREKKIEQTKIAEEIRKYESVERVDIVSGDVDMVAVVRVKDVHEFDKFLMKTLDQMEGIDKTRSYIVLNSGE